MVTPVNQRVREHRAREKAGEQCPRCACSRLLKGEKSKLRGHCSHCHKKTPEYLQYLREYQKEHYTYKRAKKTSVVKTEVSSSKKAKPKARARVRSKK